MKKIILTALMGFGLVALFGCNTTDSYHSDKASARVKSCSAKYGCEKHEHYSEKDRPAEKKYDCKALHACAKSNS